jgi:phosphatidylinositol alpha-1,6-mannosyltransferase
MSNPQPRPRILIVTRNLPPLVGGMERLNWHMAEELARVADVRVIGPEGSAALAPNGVQIREAPLRPLWKFLLRARTLARREAKGWKPDVVLAGSGLTAPIARTAARACGAKTAVYVHGLDLTVRHPVYQTLWLPAIRSMDRVIANSRATAELCRGIGIDSARIGIVHPGVDLPAEVPSPSGRGCPEGAGEGPTPRDAPVDASRRSAPARDGAFRQRHHLGEGPLLLSVGRLSERKGLREFVVNALPRIVAERPDVMLLIVGDAPKDALHAHAQSPDSIQAAADGPGVGGHVQFFGKIGDEELETTYRAATVHVFPVREIPGDPEGFGMVAVEAAAHGLPTVAFASGGVVDAVAEGRSGYLVQPGDYAAFAAATVRLLSEREALRTPCIEFARQFAWSEFGPQIAHQLGLS